MTRILIDEHICAIDHHHAIISTCDSQQETHTKIEQSCFLPGRMRSGTSMRTGSRSESWRKRCAVEREGPIVMDSGTCIRWPRMIDVNVWRARHSGRKHSLILAMWFESIFFCTDSSGSSPGGFMGNIDYLQDDLVVVSSEYPLFFISQLKIEENKKTSIRNKQMIVHSMKLTMEKRVRISTQRLLFGNENRFCRPIQIAGFVD